MPPKRAALNGIESVIENAPVAVIHDTTIIDPVNVK